MPDIVENYLLLAEEIQSSENESDSERVAELESKVKELEEKVEQLQLQLDEVRTERDKLERARVEMEADREEEIKIIERVIIWLHFIMEGTVAENNSPHRMCFLQKANLMTRKADV